MTTQPLDTAAIQARCDAATDGPWYADHVDGEVYDYDGRCIAQTTAMDGPNPNAIFAAAARTDVPALLARVAELEQQLDTAPLAGWATELTTAGLEPYDGTLTLDGDDQPFARIHLAFHPDMDDTDRNKFLITLGRVVLREL